LLLGLLDARTITNFSINRFAFGGMLDSTKFIFINSYLDLSMMEFIVALMLVL
jgi:hypothetical protein